MNSFTLCLNLYALFYSVMVGPKWSCICQHRHGQKQERWEQNVVDWRYFYSIYLPLLLPLTLCMYEKLDISSCSGELSLKLIVDLAARTFLDIRVVCFGPSPSDNPKFCLCLITLPLILCRPISLCWFYKFCCSGYPLHSF